MYVYIYIYIYTSEGLTQAESEYQGAKLSSPREFPGGFESSNLSREDLGREIGRKLRSDLWPR